MSDAPSSGRPPPTGPTSSHPPPADEAPSKKRRVGRAAASVFLPGGSRVVDYYGGLIEREKRRLLLGTPNLRKLRDAAQNPVDAALLEEGVDYSVEGIREDYLKRWMLNAAYAYVIYLLAFLGGSIILLLGIIGIVSGAETEGLLTFNLLLCGGAATVLGWMLTMKSSMDIRRMSTGWKGGITTVMRTPDLWIPSDVAAFRDSAHNVVRNILFVAGILAALISGATWLIQVTDNHPLAAFASVAAMIGAIYGLYRFIIRWEARRQIARSSHV